MTEMNTASQSTVPGDIGRHETVPGAPPWFWLWAAMFALYLPLTAAGWAQAIGQVGELVGTAERMGAAGSSASRWAFLVMLPGVLVEHIPSMALALGLLTIVFPRLRAAYLERRWRLKDASGETGTLAEIEGFLRARAPGLRLKANLAVPGALLFVYPAGYRQSNVAVFGGFAVLWKSDRAAAEAVLIHEAMHRRRGDALIMGPASFFENTVKFGRCFKVILKKIGVTRRFRWYGARHTHATHLLDNQGANPKMIANRMGHSPEMLFRTYGHEMEGQQLEALAKISSRVTL